MVSYIYIYVYVCRNIFRSAMHRHVHESRLENGDVRCTAARGMKERLILYRRSIVNPLEFSCSYSATSNNMKLVHWPLMGGLLHLVQQRGDWAGPQPAQAPPCCTECISQSLYCCIMVPCSAVLMWALKG